MDGKSFNEYSRWQDELLAENGRRERQRKGIDEQQWQAEHPVWIAWAFNYENMKCNLEQGYFSIAFECDDKCKNVAEN